MATPDPKPIAVVLPGLDGTGLLLEDFAAELGKDFNVQLIRYPPDTPLDYPALLALIRPQLPAGDFILIGESFSGPLALSLAREAPAALKAVVLGASFARLDLPCKGLLAPLAALPPWLAPTWLLASLLLGRWATSQRRAALRDALAPVRDAVLTTRARAALAVDLTTSNQLIAQPLLYLRADSDRLMPRSAVESVRTLAPHLDLHDVEAPHFLLQVAPLECAALIAEFYRAAVAPA